MDHLSRFLNFFLILCKNELDLNMQNNSCSNHTPIRLFILPSIEIITYRSQRFMESLKNK